MLRECFPKIYFKVFEGLLFYITISLYEMFLDFSYKEIVI